MTIEYFDIKTKNIVSVCSDFKECSFAYLNHVKDYKYHIEQSTLLTKDLVVYVLFFGNRKPEENWLSELFRIKGEELIKEFLKSE